MSSCDLLYKNIERIDSYIEKADNKASYLLTVEGLTLVYLLQDFKIFTMNYVGLLYNFIVFLYTISMVLLFVAIIYSIKVIYPNFTNIGKTNNSYKSTIFYADILKYRVDEYLSSLSNDELLQQDLTIQIINLSYICNSKMTRCRIASYLFISSFTTTLIFKMLSI